MAPNPAALPLRVHEVTTVTPWMIRVELRDQSIKKGELVYIGTPDEAAINAFVQRTNPETDQTEWCNVVGYNKEWLLFRDTMPTDYVDRDAVKNPANWSIDNGYSITAVYYKCEPYEGGRGYSEAASTTTLPVSMKHFVYLHLDADLVNDSYIIGVPEALSIDDIDFDFDDRVTRCCLLKVNQVGYRPGDAYKGGMASEWIPGYGTEGALEITATQFHRIDRRGVIQYTGNIVNRVGPTDVEQDANFTGDDTTLHNYLDGLVRYFSTTTPPLQGTAVTTGSPTRFGYDPDGPWEPENGEVIGISGWAGVNKGDNDYVEASNVDTENHTFEIDRTFSGTWSEGAYLSGHDSLLYKTHLANRAATYVYEMDFSDDAPENGYSRLYIPGYGVSDEFLIDEYVWGLVAENAIKGVYNQRNGMALDANVGGWARPTCYEDGVTMEIHLSTLPAAFSSEFNTTGAGVPSNTGGQAPWVTETRVPAGWRGTHQDAGDHDALISAHFLQYYYMLHHGYEFAPEPVRAMGLNIPKSSTVLDPDLYAGTDDYPGVVHEVLYTADAYRRLQRSDGVFAGAVGSGMGHSGGGLGQYGPSWAVYGDSFIYAPDHYNTFAYVLVAAKLAKIFSDDGFSTLAGVWQQSAIDAWNWAEAIYLNASGERDAYYTTELGLRSKSATIDANYSTYMATLNSASIERRQAAAAALFRLTGEEEYDTVAQEIFGQAAGTYRRTAMLEYIEADGADEAVVATSLSAIGGAENSVLAYCLGDIAWRRQGQKGTYFLANSSENASAISSYQHGANANWLIAMQAGMAYVHGVNQKGYSYTTGLGARNFNEILHEDRQRGGMVAPPDGITNYGFDYPGITFRFNNFSTDSPINYVVELPTGDFESTYGTKRVYEPHRRTRPFAEQTVENRLVIFHMEYTFQASNVAQLLRALWLHGHDGNAATGVSAPRYRNAVGWGPAP